MSRVKKIYLTESTRMIIIFTYANFPEVRIINRQKFLTELGKLLSFMYEEDRQLALSMYERLFDEAEDESALIQSLVSPTRQAVLIARAYDAKTRKLSVASRSKEEDGYRETEEETPAFVTVIQNTIFDILGKDIFAENEEEEQISFFDGNPQPEEDLTDEEDLITEEEPAEEEEPTEEETAEEEELIEEEETSGIGLHEPEEIQIYIPKSELLKKEAEVEEEAQEPEPEQESLQSRSKRTTIESLLGFDLDEGPFEAEPTKEPETEIETESVSVSEEILITEEQPSEEQEKAVPPEEKEAETAEAPEEEAESEIQQEVPEQKLPVKEPEKNKQPEPEKKAVPPEKPETEPVIKKNLRMRRQKREKIETKTELKIPMLILFLIVAIPVTLLGIAVLLVPTIALLFLAVGLIFLGAMLILGAFSGFAVLADILLLVGGAIVTLAMGLLCLWLTVWLIMGVMTDLVKAVRDLAKKLCYKEVPVL